MTWKELRVVRDSIIMLYNAIHDDINDSDCINSYINTHVKETIECGEMLDSTLAIAENDFEERFLKSLLKL